MTQKIFDRANQSIFSNWFWRIDKTSFTVVVLLMLFGLVCVSTASIGIADKLYENPTFFIKKQIFYVIVSLVILSSISLLPTDFFYKAATYLYVLAAVLTISTLFFGMEVKGSKRWLLIGNSSIQPSEFFKITLILLNAKILTNLIDIENSFEKTLVYCVSLFVCIFSIGLLALQPDVGMSCLIFCSWIAQLFVTGISFFILFIPILLFAISGVVAYSFFDHVNYRINSYLNSSINSSELYQVRQSIETFKNGGLFGVGPWQGKAKFHLPDAHTDFIFSVIGEEFGIIVCALLIFIYYFLAVRSMKIVICKKNLFNILLVVGLGSQFLIQALINIGVNIRLLPAKGMTLPFISYGGSSLLASAFLFGIILTVNKKDYTNTII